MRKVRVEFIHREGELPNERLDLPIEDIPTHDSWFKLHNRGKFRVFEVTRHYGKKGLLRVEVVFTRKTWRDIHRETLGTAAERVGRG